MAVACVSASASATAATVRHAADLRRDAASSSNWAGYGVTPTLGGTVTSFSNVVGTWVQPAVTCTAGTPSYSAFWIGLGGMTQESTSLEQIGTESNCASDGSAHYDAWYEILPAPPVPLKVAVAPGDRMSAAVTVTGRIVRMRLRNLTRHTVVNRKLTMAAPDTTSAEWVAEAPSSCTRSGRCSVLPLANFGSVDFLQAAATGSRHPGLIPDTAWTATAITLDGGRPAGFFGSGGGASASAVPTVVSPAGSFSVAWQAPATTR